MVYTRSMPWMETHRLDQRAQFIAAFLSQQWSMTELCSRFGVSRPTGYKWVTRHQMGGAPALADGSHAPHSCPHRTPSALTARILAVRREYGWGATKLLTILCQRYPSEPWPARSTINDLLQRHGLLPRRRRRTTWAHPGAAPLV